MALNPIIEVIDSDRLGSSISVRDISNDYPTLNSIERLNIRVYNDRGYEGIANYVRVRVLPEDHIYPLLDNILSGQIFNLSNSSLGTGNKGEPFCDGIYNIYYSVILATQYPVSNGRAGRNVIFLPDAADYYQYDVIYAHGKVYRIDKTAEQLSTTDLWLLDYIEKDIDVIQVGYSDKNTFFMAKQALSKTVLATGISADGFGVYRKDVLEAASYIQAANDAFDDGDEETSDKFIHYANKIVDRLV